MTAAGWYADPTGRFDHRYWNGAAWTEHVSRAGVQATDGLPGAATPSEASGQQAIQWGAARASSSAMPLTASPPQPVVPPAAWPARKKAKWPWIVGGIFGLFILLGGGCAVLIGVAANHVANQLDAEQRAHAITPAQFVAVPLGATQPQVIALLGKPPENTQEFTSRGVLDQAQISSLCIYYNRAGGSFGDRYQFCFMNGALDTKNSY
jgi:hypothetical protein